MRYIFRVDRDIAASPSRAETSAIRQVVSGIIMIGFGTLVLGLAQPPALWSVCLGVGCIAIGIGCLWAGYLLARLWWRAQIAWWRTIRDGDR